MGCIRDGINYGSSDSSEKPKHVRGGTEQSQFAFTHSSSITETETKARVMNHLNIETDNSFYSLLEFASDNNAEGIKKFIDNDASSLNRKGLWYIRPKGSKRVICDWRTPLMVAATYGCLDVLNLILSNSEVNVNLSCGRDKSTALHCAAAGGSIYVVEVIVLLLSSGADPKCVDASGNRPIDVIFVHPKIKRMGVKLEDLLKINTYSTSFDLPLSIETMGAVRAVSPIHSSSEGNVSSPSQFTSSPVALICTAGQLNLAAEKEYPADPSLPDIKSSMYATDEFRMFSFKVRPCSRAYSHDWTDCPFVHPGENARRRDPRKYHYSCMPCPNFKKGPCRHGDKCEYAHGVFESWLHPAQYRTQLCKDGTSCNRRVCFFAHTIKELRPSHLSIGSGGNSVHCNSSPSNVIDMVTPINHLPGFPSLVSASTLSPSSSGLSPSLNGVSQSISWPQPSVPSIHLPGSNLQSSRLSCPLGSRNRPCGGSNMIPEFDSSQQISNDLTCFSRSQMNINSIVRSKMQPPSNIDGIFTSYISSSPKFPDPATTSIFSPTHKSIALNQCRKQKQIMPTINQSILSPRSDDCPLLASFELSSRRRILPRNVEPMSPVASRFSAYVLEEMQHQQLRSLASKDLATNVIASPVMCSSNSWPNCGSPEEVDWSVNGDDLALFERFKLKKNAEEPDLSWIQTLVKEPPPEMIR